MRNESENANSDAKYEFWEIIKIDVSQTNKTKEKNIDLKPRGAPRSNLCFQLVKRGVW